MKKKLKNKGILFWVTGLSGSGKTTIAKIILPKIIQKFGPTIHLDGDQLRKDLKLYGYSYNDRLDNSKKMTNIAKIITDQNINVVFSILGLISKIRVRNKKIFKNYIEIFINTKLENIIKLKKKKTYYQKKNVVGVNIKPEFPKKSDVIINNLINKKSFEDKIFNEILKAVKRKL